MPLASASANPWSLRRTHAGLGIFVLACLVVFSLAPIALVEIPAMVDYPNHLARMSILARAGTPAAHPLYEVAWAPYPNLAMDLIVPPLARWIGVETATRLFCLAAQLLVIAGTMSLATVAGGSMLTAGAVACLFIYAMPFAFGFLNFSFALGLALFAMAGWLRWADRPLAQRLAAHTIVVAILYFAHLFALGLYGFTIGIIELRRIANDRPPLSRSAALFAGMAAPAILIAVLAGTHGGSVGGSGSTWSVASKVFWLGIQNGWSRELAVASTLALAIPVSLAFKRGWLRLVGPGPWLVVGFGLLFLALPFKLFDTGYVDGRVLMAAILVVPAFARANPPSEGLRRGIAALAVLICLINGGYAAYLQGSYQVEYAALRRAFEAMPRGSRLLPTYLREEQDPPVRLADYPMYHAATLAVHSRDAFVPTLFAYPGKQPLRTKPSVEHLKLLEGGPIPWRILEFYAGGGVPPGNLAYVKDWPREFDFLLLVHPDGQELRSEFLEPIARGGHFVLYRITGALGPLRAGL